MSKKKIAIIGASGKLGKYMIKHCLELNYDIIGVCREESMNKLDEYKDEIKIIGGRTNDENIIQQAVHDVDGVLTVLVPWGVDDYSSGTANAVLKYAPKNARLIFSCGWHITKDGRDEYSKCFLCMISCFGCCARTCRFADIDDQVRACNAIFESDTRWTVVRGSDLEEGPSEGLPVWAEYVQDPKLQSNITRRIDFALFMVHALTNDELIHKAPAIVSCKSESAIKSQ